MEDFQDAAVTVMGLGRLMQGSGVGATKWLIRHGAQVVITDLKTEADLKESVTEVMKWYEQYRKDYPTREIYHPLFVLGQHRAEDFTDVQAVLQNPDVRSENEFVQLAREHNVPIYSDVSLFFQLCPLPIVAVTGTRGKSTTTAMLGEMERAVDPKTVVAGNIKVSPLEFLDEILEEKTPRPIVLELSSTLIESLEAQGNAPKIAIMTNLYPDHLNRYKNFDDYKSAKERMFSMQKADQFSVMNKENADVVAVASRIHSQIFWFTKGELAAGENGCFVKDGQIIFRRDGKDETICATTDILLEGEHNLEDALAAACAARLNDVPAEKIKEVLKTFKGMPERQEIIRELNGVTYVDDTTATSPEGAIAALNRFSKKGQIILLAGGASKDLPLEGLAKEIQAICKYVILFDGTATDKLEALIGSLEHVRVNSMKAAVEAASSIAQSGDIVLLSPGCASFGLFKNEFDRGAKFQAEVAKLK